MDQTKQKRHRLASNQRITNFHWNDNNINMDNTIAGSVNWLLAKRSNLLDVDHYLKDKISLLIDLVSAINIKKKFTSWETWQKMKYDWAKGMPLSKEGTFKQQKSYLIYVKPVKFIMSYRWMSKCKKGHKSLLMWA